MPFFKKDESELLSAPNFVAGPDFELSAAEKDTYEYPVHGWYWFDTLDSAIAFFATQTPDGVVSITNRQGKLLLLSETVTVGEQTVPMLMVVEGYIASIEDPVQRKAVEIEFNGPTWESNNPFVLSMWTQVLGQPAENLHDKFVAAKQL